MRALLVEEELADLVWEALDSGFLSDQTALSCWVQLANTVSK